MRLMLVDDDSNVIETWNIEGDFGDLSKPFPQREMVERVRDAIDAHAREVGR